MLSSNSNERVERAAEEKAARKHRQREQKEGKWRYWRRRLTEILENQQRTLMMQRTILTGLKDFFSFDKALIEKAVCVDEVDKLILEVLFQAGSEGKFPKYLARDPLLKRFQLSRFAVVRRLIQMNKRLKQEIGMSVVEKRGHKWALTSFAFKVWGETDEEGYEPDEEILDRRALM